MKISIDELRSQPQQRLLVSFKEELRGLEAVKPVIGELQLSADSSGARVSGAVQTLLKLNCDRCLRPYFLAINVPIEERYVEQFQVEGVPRDRELLRDDFFEPLPSDGMLDISDMVYQAVTLATPNFCLCGDECPGPEMPLKGSNEASSGPAKDNSRIDPRWQNLKTLFPNGESDEKS
jgi:uncharacterized metal-binding protein YceD (DUF177 family)